MKYVNFSITETAGRTFEIPYDKAKELLEDECKRFGEKFENLSGSAMAHYLYAYYSDEIAEFEKYNDYCDYGIDVAEIIEQVA